MRTLFCCILLLCVCSAIKSQEFDIRFSLDEFIEIIPGSGILQYEDLTLTIDETEIIDSLGFELIKQVTIQGPVTLPGGTISIGGFLSGDGYGVFADVYSQGEIVASQALAEELVNTDLIYENKTPFLVDQVVIRSTDSTFVFPAIIEIELVTELYLLSHYSNPFETEEDVLNPGRPIHSYSEDVPAFKVCTDGDSSSIFGLLSFPALFDPANALIDFTEINWQLRIKEDPEGLDPERFGSVSSEPTVSNSSFRSYTYTHPAYLPVESDTIIHLEIIDQATGFSLDEFRIRLFTAPVLLVHGLWGSRNSFNALQNRLIQSTLYPPSFILAADYEVTNHRFFAENQVVVPNFIDSLRQQILAEKIAVGKFNVVAHSMGGIISRLYIQNSDYRDDVYKLITINTPHSGSQLANILFDPVLQNEIPDETICEDVIDEYLAKKVGACYGGAVFDLQVGSDAIRELNRPENLSDKVFLHAISSDVEGFDWLKLGLSALIPDDFEVIFNNNPNDVIVERASQRGGLSLDANTHFSEGQHLKIQNREDVIAMIEMLLLANPESSLFDKKYNPAVIEYNRPEINNEEEGFLSGFSITNPIEGRVFQFGEDLDIQISANQPLSEFAVFWGAPGTLSLIENSEKVDGLIFERTVVLQEKQLGRYFINAMGVDEVKSGTKKVFLDKRTVFVTTDKAPSSIVIVSPDFQFHSVSIGEDYNVLVEAKIEGDTFYVQEAPGVQYVFDNGYAEYVGNGKIRGTTVGIDTMRVIFNGIASPPIRVRVVESEIPSSTSHYSSGLKISKLMVFPSPASDFIQIEPSEQEKGIRGGLLYISDQLGRNVMKKNYEFFQHSMPIHITELRAGIYSVSLIIGNQIYSGSFIKI